MVEKEPASQPELKPRFDLGRIVGTPGALEALTQAGQDPMALISRQARGDWGEVPDEDKAENEFSVNNDLRIMSVYTLTNGVTVWIITEADDGRVLGPDHDDVAGMWIGVEEAVLKHHLRDRVQRVACNLLASAGSAILVDTRPEEAYAPPNQAVICWQAGRQEQGSQN